MSIFDAQFTCGVRVKGCIYASCRNFNGLIKISLDNMQSEVMGIFPDEDKYKKSLHSNAIKEKNLVYFFPATSKHLHILDTNTMCISSIKLCDSKYEGEYYGKKIGKKIFLIPKIHRSFIIN